MIKKVSERVIEGFKKLNTCEVSDVLTNMGYSPNSMSSEIRPIASGYKICGSAFTLRAVPYRKGDKSIAYQAIDEVERGQVVVKDGGGTGDNQSIALKARGVEGTVVDGPCRDIKQIIEIGYPVFCKGVHPGGSNYPPLITWVCERNVPIGCGGVQVKPGDIVFGDDSGVVIIPSLIAEDALRFSNAYAELDREVADGIEAGKSSTEANKIKDLWQKKIGLQDWLNQQR